MREVGHAELVAGSIRILLVADDRDAREHLSDALGSTLDAEVVVETGSRAALETLQSQSFDCVVSEHDLPEMDGVELLADIRDVSPTLPVVLLSTVDAAAIAGTEVANVGADHVTKNRPETVEVLVNRVRTQIQKYRAEQQLTELQTLYRQWMDVAVDGFFAYDPATDALTLERDVGDLFGVESAHVDDGREWLAERIHPQDRERVFDAIREGDHQESAVGELEFRFATATDAYRHVHSRYRLVYDSAEEHVRTLGAIWDVTDRITRERALERVNRASQAFATADSPEAIASLAIEAVEDAFEMRLSSIWYLDETGAELRMVDCTPDAAAMLNRAGSPPFVHAEGDPIWDAFASGELTVLTDLETADLTAPVPVKTMIIAPLGEYGLIAMASEADQPFSERDRDLTRILARNVTTALDRLDHERRLETNRDLLARTQRLAAVGAWEYVLGTGTLEWTDQVRRIHGTAMDADPTVETAIDLYHPEDRSRVRKAFDHAREYGIGFDQRVRIVRRDDGTVRWVRNVGEPVIEDGTVRRIRGAIQDITHHHTQRRHLEQNEASLRDLNEILTDPDRRLDDQIDALLDLGRDRVDLSVGFMTAIDDGQVEITRVCGSDGLLAEGQTMPLDETFCRLVLENGSLTGVYDTHTLDYTDDPGYRHSGLAAYLGAPLFVEGELRGTICFGDSTARERPFTDLEREFVRVLVEQASHLFAQQQQHQRLQTLHDASRFLLAADDVSEIPPLTIEAIESVPDAPPLLVYRWTEATGALSLVDRSATARRTLQSAPASIQDASDPVWQAFVEGEIRTIDSESADTDAWSDGESVPIAVPVGEFGVLVATRSVDAEAVSFEIEFLKTLAQNVVGALATVEQNQQLQEYAARLESQNDRLERLGRINAIVRDTQRTLVEASSRTAVEQTVCANLAEIDHWELAWIGTRNLVEDAITVRAASDDRATSLAMVDSDAHARPIAARTLDSQRVVEVSNVLSADGPEPWRKTALEYGYQSALSIPISYADREFGVLEIYADRPGAFAPDERDVLTELGTTIAYAIASTEQRRASHADRRVTLDLVLPERTACLPGFGDRLSQPLTITSVVPRTDESYLAYATVADPTTAAETLRSIPIVESAAAFGPETNRRLEFQLRESRLLETLTAYEATLTHLEVAERENRLQVVLPRSVQIRSFLERLRDVYPGTTLAAQRSDEADDAPSMARPLSPLTDRQREILTIAYQRGLFEWPRESSGEDVADTLAIAPATFHQHLRAAQRRLLDSILRGR